MKLLSGTASAVVASVSTFTTSTITFTDAPLSTTSTLTDTEPSYPYTTSWGSTTWVENGPSIINDTRTVAHATSPPALPTDVSPPYDYSHYILAPDNRTIAPVSVYNINGSVTNAEAVTATGNGTAVFDGLVGVTYDYGKNIAGVVSVTVGASSSPGAFIGLTYSESSLWISPNGSDATQDIGIDDVLWLAVGEGPGTYSVSRDHERGAFRYLSLVTNTSGTIEVTAVTTNFTAAPANDLRAYSGYFNCNEELLNRIWYAGAYTNQLCTIDPTYGYSLVTYGDDTPRFSNDWYVNYTITNGSSCTVDGAKRDRLVWPGDLVVSAPAIFVSTNDMYTVKNSLESLLVTQDADGMLPYAGRPYPATTSFTYHLHNLIAMADYYLYTGNITWMQQNWYRWTAGISWSLSNIDDTGLMNVTSTSDWLRVGMGGHNIEANAILYYTLNRGIDLASDLNDTTYVANWTASADKIQSAANTLLWNETAGLFMDNETTTLAPQDGNAWAVKAGLASVYQASRISSALRSRWGPYGAPAPEGGDTLTVSPYIGGFELEAHILAGNTSNALDLLRLQWGFMLLDPRMTGSSFIEGYSANGSLHYAPYAEDSRVSHAHGWSTAPTSLLTFYVAGIQLTSPAGKTWKMKPHIGNLRSVVAGFNTLLGAFSIDTYMTYGSLGHLRFSAPANTTGEVDLRGLGLEWTVGTLESVDANMSISVDRNQTASNVPGGHWDFVMRTG